MQGVLSLTNIKRKTQVLMINSNEAKAGDTLTCCPGTFTQGSASEPQARPWTHTHTHTKHTLTSEETNSIIKPNALSPIM